MSSRIKGIIDAVSDLAMDYQSRMARAKDQGFDTDTPVYHSTASDFDAFDPDRAIGSQFWSTTDRAAIESGDVGAQGKGVVKEMYQRINNPAGWNEYDKFGIDELIGQGYDGLKLPDTNGQSTMVAFNPNQYRSVNAAFDPAKKDSSNLLASVTGAGLLGGSMLASEDADAGILSRIKAFHGSPHDFDRFSSENIGTGEGAQAYGHGLYFAEREGTAQSYRDALTPRDFDYEEHLMEQYKAAESMQDYNRMDMLERAMQHDTPADFRDIASDVDYDDDYRQLANDMADEMEGFVNPRGNPVNFGRMYEVDINASADDLLDYDVPLKDQPEKIQNAFKDIWRDGLADDPILKDIYKTADDVDFNTMGLFDQSQGSQAYKEFANKLGGEAAFSKLLNDKGIKGVKYADAQTRFSPKGRTNNYVIFDEKTIEIARKYGVSMPVAGAILAGTMTPEDAQASNQPASKGLMDSFGDTALETMSGVNRAMADGVNFLTSDQINAMLNLSGSDKRIPDLYDIPGVESGTKGNYMEPGLLRQIVRQGSEFLSPI
jgi:hypothetical protein